MATPARVEITILSYPVSGENIEIEFDSEPILISERALAQRGGAGAFSIEDGDGGQLSLDEIANKLTEALNLDYTPGGLAASYPVIASRGISLDPVVWLDATEIGHTFTLIQGRAWANVVITPEVPDPPTLEIDSITANIADGPDKCGTVRYDFIVYNAVYPIDITSPVVKTAANAGELFFDFSRYPVPQDSLDITDDSTATDSVVLPRVSTYNLTGVDVLETFQGATITINTSIVNAGDVGLSFTYSIDDSNYGPSNVFYGVTPGNYTAYSLDNFGCKKTKTFEVVGITVDKPDPIFNIVNNNSFKFFEKQLEAFDGKTSFPNYDNSQLNEQLYFNTEKTCYYQPVQQNDSPETQILTNYETVTAELKNLSTDKVVAILSPTEVVTNILQKDKRDCKIIDGDTDKTVIYFPGGNIYEPDTTTYDNPNLLLPAFLDSETIESGVKVTLSGNAILNGTFDVEKSISIELSDGSIAQGIQINAIYTGVSTGTNAIVQSLYNSLDYNVWEFTTVFDTIQNGLYYLDVNGTDSDPRYLDVRWLSEPIKVEDSVWKKTTYIEWFNSENLEGSDFSTSIIHMARFPARFVKYGNGGEKETFEDSQGRVVPLREVIVRDITIETSLMPQYMVEKLNLISAHDNITINGLSGTFVDKSEDEGLLEEQNRNYKSVAVFRLSETTTIGGSSIISQAGEVLGVGAGNFVLSIKY